MPHPATELPPQPSYLALVADAANKAMDKAGSAAARDVVMAWLDANRDAPTERREIAYDIFVMLDCFAIAGLA